MIWQFTESNKSRPGSQQSAAGEGQQALDRFGKVSDNKG